MQLTVHDVCRLLNVNERTVRRWVREEQLPASRVGGRYHFNRSELFEWATLRKMPVPAELLEGDDAPPLHGDTLADAIVAGGIFYQLPGNDIESALRSVVDCMRLPDKFDREMLLNMFLSRERLGSTAVGDGIALPHPRYPVVLPVPGPQVSLCYLEHAIDFAAADGRPVDTLFVLVSPTARWHARLLTQVARALAHPRFRGVVLRRAPADEIIAASRTFPIAGESSNGDQGSH